MTATLVSHGQAGREASWAANRSRTAARIEDMRFLLGCGVSAQEAVHRAGWPNVAAANRALYRAGETELARTIGPAAHAHRHIA